MKRIIVFLSMLSFSVMAQAQKEFVVDANAEQRTISGSFNTVMVSGGIDLYLSQSENEAVAVSASEERFVTDIKVTVDNNTLRIYYDGDKGWTRKNRSLRAYVSFKNLEKLDASGASDIIVSGEIKVPSLSVKLSGASDFKGALTVSTLKLDLSGASDVKISGTATVVNIESSGASDVKAYELSTDICTAKASGASDVNITVNKELNAHASGASEIFYKGSAVIKDVQSSGASSIKKRN
jgi:hypothetical protein